MLSIILISSFLTINIFSYFYFKKWIKKNFIKKETVRKEFKDSKQKCLYKSQFNWREEDGSSTIVDVLMECEIIEEFEDCYKIKILNCGVSDLKYKKRSSIESYLNAWDNSFVDKKDKGIKLLIENKLQRRRKILKQILEKC